ncbi:unnamed protein product [Meganyctiphanes norvegica]|uniref:Uncharacterized protein n=1 Tax=Meganyctiphanes norvegica TaxID=48144 RepID=A0AAV2RZ61_MEGNR
MSGSARTSRIISQSQPHSPSPVSPRITTPRMADFNLTSSSDTQEEISLILKSKDIESSSQSEEGGRRHHSEERKRGSSNRLHEKRRNTDIEVMQLSQEDRDKLKDSGKLKRKTEFVTKRRDKREKSVSPTENVEKDREILNRKDILNYTLNDSQSSVAEDVASDTFTHSDAASSVSENDSNFQRVSSSVKEIFGSQKYSSTSASQSEIMSVQSKGTEKNIISSPEEVLTEVVESRNPSKVSEAHSYTTIESESVLGSIKSKSASVVSETNLSYNYTQPSSEIPTKSSAPVAIDSRIGSSSRSSSEVKTASDHVRTDESRTSRSEIRTGSDVKSGESRTSKSSTEVRTGSDVRTSESRTSRSSNESKMGVESSKVSDFRLPRSSSESRSSLDGKSINDYRSTRNGMPLPFRVPLSPRSPQRHYRRYSSESDDSMSFSQNETASDVSDGEGRLLALKEQLESRRAEADRLKKEKRRLRRERLDSQEQALRQQISAYDAYIVQARKDLEEESRQIQQASLVKPLIKKPQVAETRRKSDIGIMSPEKSDISDLSQLSEVSKAELTASPTSPNEKSETGSLSEDSKCPSGSVKSQTSESVSYATSSSINSQDSKSFDKNSKDIKSIKRSVEENLEKAKLKLSIENESEQKISIPQTKTDAVQDSQESSVSENISFEEDFESEKSTTNLVDDKEQSQEDSGPDTDKSPSHISTSSTETIVHSPKKQSVVLHEDAEATSGEVTPSALSAADNDEQEDWEEKVIDSEFEITAPEVQRVVEPVTEVQLAESSDEKNLLEKDKTFDSEPGEKKIEIFLPNLDIKSSDEENNDKSIEESIAEEGSHSESNKNLSESENDNESSYSNSETKLAENKSEGDSVEKSDNYEIGNQQKNIEHKDESEDEEKVLSMDSSLESEENDKVLDKTYMIKETPTSATSKEIQESDINIPEAESKVDTRVNDKLVDTVTSSILGSLMRETTHLFSNILDGKAQFPDGSTKYTTQQPLELSGAGENEGIDRQGGSYMDFEIKDDCDNSIEKSTQEDADFTGQTLKSQILRRVSQIISEGNSPRSAVSSPRSTDLPLTPHLTFDLSPDVLSPTSAPTSPHKNELWKAQSVATSEVVESIVMTSSTGSRSDVIEDKNTSASGILVIDSLNDDQEGEKSSEQSPGRAQDYMLDTASLTSKLLQITTPEVDLEGGRFGESDGTEAEFSVEGIEGDWFDDDFWTNSDSKKKQQQLKAEEQRIAAEIARLEELQRLQEQFPGLVIRDIPNKPPPPYTPPGTPTSTTPVPDYSTTPSPEQTSHLQKSSNVISVAYRLSRSDLRALAHEMVVVVARDRTQVQEVINDALEELLRSWEEGINPQDLPTPDNCNTIRPSSGDSDEDDENSIRVFHKLLFHLAQEIVGQVWQVRHTPAPPVWQRSVLPAVKVLQLLQQQPRHTLPTYITAQVDVLFGWGQHKPKDTLMIRWAKKHRDLVDQVLVGELAVEESSWTHYGVDEAAVKTSLSEEIFTALIDDTVSVCLAVLQKKMLMLQE